jgi:hypothetical protein
MALAASSGCSSVRPVMAVENILPGATDVNDEVTYGRLFTY